MKQINYFSPGSIIKLLTDRDLKPNKNLGQNFLIDRNIHNIIIRHILTDNPRQVWEIGPGLGALTHAVQPQVDGLVLFELDAGYVRFLKELFENKSGITICHGDFLKTWQKQGRETGTPDAVFGNLPYNGASRIIGRFAEERFRPAKMVFTVQKEMAARMCAVPGSKDYAALSILCQSAFTITCVKDIGPGAFYPSPKVTSTVITLRPSEHVEQILDWTFFKRFVKACFVSRRKKLSNNLKKADCLAHISNEVVNSVFSQAGRSPDQRAEELDLSDFIMITNLLARQTQ